ncbi:MAG: V-type ATP synthase subunit K [Ruminococcaceae bacterium]|nr:V-type ATP synthase subunit K [Oscillospiraceae bacterium]
MFIGLFSGTNLALLGVALAIVLPCIGSAKGVGIVGEAATGLLSEQPGMFGKAFPLMALPMTQGIYGLVAAFMTLMNLGLFKSPDYLMNLTYVQGGYILMASLPIAIAGLFSALRQGRVAAAGINLVGKRPNSLGQAITTAALVETYAIFALLITILLIMRCPFRV